MKRFKLLSIIVLITGILYGCKKDEPVNVNKELLNVMEEYYLWYNEMPTVDPNSYPSPVELLDALTYKELDRWSYITTKQELEAYYQNAEYVGYGIGLGFDAQNQLRITFIFEDSPMRAIGVDRGWRVSAINGNTPTISNINNLLAQSSALFTFIDLEEQSHTQNFSKKVVQMNTVLMDTVYTTASAKVGYFVLKGFVGPTVDELTETFSSFIMDGVTELIVDLRYNGGGAISTAEHLASLIAGKIAAGSVLGKYVHNDKQTSRDESFLISNHSYALPLNRVVFITTENSASASELLINGLFPHMEVSLVGSRTYGKPVGMYAFTSPSFDWAFVPICFRVLNANDEGDYYDGIPVNIPAADNINYPFGDLRESSLAAAMSLLDGSKAKLDVTSTQSVSYPTRKGLKGEIGAW
ncbi:MAG: S41 family peptidase [Tenuifilaceae bacterium]|jgi:C-terminal processing protease CtpA/Prc|nr:S41 family peptidase [Tenuifilaceae bacterium]